MDEVVYQLQKAAAARRIDLLLNQGVDAGEVIRRAAGDAMALAVLREDITFSAGDTREAQVRQESLLDQLDQAQTPLMSASKQAAMLLEAELQTGWANVQTSLSLARAEAGGASQTSSSGYPVGVRSILAGWAPGSTIRLGFTDPSGGLSKPDTPVQESRAAFMHDPAIAARDAEMARPRHSTSARLAADHPRLKGHNSRRRIHQWQPNSKTIRRCVRTLQRVSRFVPATLARRRVSSAA